MIGLQELIERVDGLKDKEEVLKYCLHCLSPFLPIEDKVQPEKFLYHESSKKIVSPDNIKRTYDALEELLNEVQEESTSILTSKWVKDEPAR